MYDKSKHKMTSLSTFNMTKTSMNTTYFDFIIYFEGFTSIPTALTANDRNRRIQVYQASDG